jgi:hypothetical protein
VLWSGLRAQVLKERSERLQPSIADNDAATAIVSKVVVPWVAATLPHLNPGDVFGRLSVMPYIAMADH